MDSGHPSTPPPPTYGLSAYVRAKHSRTEDPRTTTPPRQFVDDISHSPVVYFERLNGRNNHHHNDGRHHHVQSLFRVGETVLRRSRSKPSTLRPHKAWTYDHVHALVQGIEEDLLAVFSGKVGLANLGNTCFSKPAVPVEHSPAHRLFVRVRLPIRDQSG